MYTTKTFEEIKKDDALLMSLYRLCYIDGINPTYNDYTPEAKAYRETDEWKEQDRLRDKKLHRQGYMSYDDPEFGYWTNPVLKKACLNAGESMSLERALTACKKASIEEITYVQYMALMNQLGAVA